MNGLTPQENLFWAVAWSSIVGCYCRNWLGRNYVQMAYKLLSLKPWVPVSSKVLHCSWSNLSGQVQAFILQAINALRDREIDHKRLLFFVHSYCKQIVNIVPVYKQASRLLLASRCSCKCSEMSLTWVFWLFGSWIFKSGKFLLKLRADHSGKFAPGEINPLYGNFSKKKWNLNKTPQV